MYRVRCITGGALLAPPICYRIAEKGKAAGLCLLWFPPASWLYDAYNAADLQGNFATIIINISILKLIWIDWVRCFSQSIWLFKTLQMNRCLEVSTKIQRDLLPRLHDCLKPPDEQMFGCFTKHYLLIRSNACLKLIDKQMFGCLPKIHWDFLLRSHDCLKPPDKQIF